MPVRCADINHTLCATFCGPPDKRFGKWEKMREAAFPNPSRICDAHNKSVTATCGRWFDSPGGGHELLIVRNSATRNLPLAARPGVGHIGLTGDVAEWLKAAVC
jgi:hypothetical protein